MTTSEFSWMLFGVFSTAFVLFVVMGLNWAKWEREAKASAPAVKAAEARGYEKGLEVAKKDVILSAEKAARHAYQQGFEAGTKARRIDG